MSEVRCPSCSKVVDVGDAAPGTQVVCDGCEASMIVPPAAGRHAGGGGAGVLSVLAAPASGAVRALWLGLLLIVISFAVKQVIFSSAMWNMGTALEEPRLALEREADLQRSSGSRSRILEEYRERREELEGQSAEAGASALTKLQWYCYLKLVLDLLRLAGAVLVLFSALHIAVDRGQGPWVKAYGVVCGGVALLVVVLGGLVSLVG